MFPGNILSTSLQVATYCPPDSGKFPGVPEKAYQPSAHTHSFALHLIHQTGMMLINIGERLASVDQPCTNAQWVEELT